RSCFRFLFFFSSRRRHTRFSRDWSSDVCSSDLVDAVLEQGGIRDLVVVMRDVTFIDSSGLGALLGRYKRLQALGGRVRIVAPPRHVRAVLELSGVPKLIPILRSERQALDAG